MTHDATITLVSQHGTAATIPLYYLSHRFYDGLTGTVRPSLRDGAHLAVTLSDFKRAAALLCPTFKDWPPRAYCECEARVVPSVPLVGNTFGPIIEDMVRCNIDIEALQRAGQPWQHLLRAKAAPCLGVYE